MYRTRTHTRWLQSPVVRLIPTHPGPMLCGRHTLLRRHFLSCLTYIMLRTHMYRNDITPVNKHCYLRNTLRRSPAGFNQSNRIAVGERQKTALASKAANCCFRLEKRFQIREGISRASQNGFLTIQGERYGDKSGDGDGPTGGGAGGARRRGDGDERN